jgi:hypothetical protein
MPVRRDEDRLRGLAVLKLSMQLGGRTGGGYDEVYRGALDDLGTADGDVDRYIEAHRDELETLCRGRGLVK